MGNFTQPITLHSESGDDSIVVDALVDTGATFSGFPAPLLESLGIRPQRKVRLRLSNGRVEERNLGEVKAALNGEDSTIHCVFGDPESPAVIGAIILEAFLLAVDPVDQRLVPLGAYW